MQRIISLLVAALVLASALSSGIARAQVYPTQPANCTSPEDGIRMWAHLRVGIRTNSQAASDQAKVAASGSANDAYLSAW